MPVRKHAVLGATFVIDRVKNDRERFRFFFSQQKIFQSIIYFTTK